MTEEGIWAEYRELTHPFLVGYQDKINLIDAECQERKAKAFEELLARLEPYRAERDAKLARFYTGRRSDGSLYKRFTLEPNSYP